MDTSQRKRFSSWRAVLRNENTRSAIIFFHQTKLTLIFFANLINSINSLAFPIPPTHFPLSLQHKCETHFTWTWSKNKRRNHNWLEGRWEKKSRDDPVGKFERQLAIRKYLSMVKFSAMVIARPIMSLLQKLHNFFKSFTRKTTKPHDKLLFLPTGHHQCNLNWRQRKYKWKKIHRLCRHKNFKPFAARSIHEWI